jgi:hypothetical protein
LKMHLVTLLLCQKINNNNMVWRIPQMHPKDSLGSKPWKVLSVTGSEWNQMEPCHLKLSSTDALNQAEAELVLKGTELYKGTSVLRKNWPTVVEWGSPSLTHFLATQSKCSWLTSTAAAELADPRKGAQWIKKTEMKEESAAKRVSR